MDLATSAQLCRSLDLPLHETSNVGSVFCSAEPYIDCLIRQEALRMSELMDSSDLRSYAIGLLYILSAVTPSVQYVEPVMDALIEAVRTSPVSLLI
jgi:hypothetical protein